MDGEDNAQYIYYGKHEPDDLKYKIWIKQSDFFDEYSYGEKNTFPKRLKTLAWDGEEIPYLCGESYMRNSRGVLEIGADFIATAYVMLSRYQELIYREKRDEYGRFLASDDLFFLSGVGLEPLVDKYGLMLRNELRSIGIQIQPEKTGIKKIYLTHDVDAPFRSPSFLFMIKDVAKTLVVNRKLDTMLLSKYCNKSKDEYYTFDEIIDCDGELKHVLGDKVESIYFIIAAKADLKNGYCPIHSARFKRLLKVIQSSGASVGIHLSHEAGANPDLISTEIKMFPIDTKGRLMSRNHYLRWCNPGDCKQMIEAGITDDYTMSYADSVGFRVGTCRPYKFINPIDGQITDLIIHPLNIMECTLDEKKYMNLSYEKAYEVSLGIIQQCVKYHGDLNLLWHNQEFSNGSYQPASSAEV